MMERTECSMGLRRIRDILCTNSYCGVTYWTQRHTKASGHSRCPLPPSSSCLLDNITYKVCMDGMKFFIMTFSSWQYIFKSDDDCIALFLKMNQDKSLILKLKSFYGLTQNFLSRSSNHTPFSEGQTHKGRNKSSSIWEYSWWLRIWRVEGRQESQRCENDVHLGVCAITGSTRPQTKK